MSGAAATQIKVKVRHEVAEAVTNINSEVLLPLLSELKCVLKSKGHIILACFLVEEEVLLHRGLSENGLHLCRLERQGDWASAVAEDQGM